MEAIFPFKPLDRFRNYNKDKDLYFQIAELAVKSAKLFYKTRLITDTEGKEIFEERGIHFDTVEILDSIDNYTGNNIAFPKLYAMQTRKYPYIMLDFDSILHKPVPITKGTVYGHPEFDFTKALPGVDIMKYLYTTYIKDYYEKIEGKSSTVDSSLEWFEFPSMSLFHTDVPNLVSDCIFTLIKDYGVDTLEITSPQLIEQFLLFNLFNSSNFRIIPLQETPGDDIKDENTYYTHLNSAVREKYRYVLPYLDFQIKSKYDEYMLKRLI